MPEATAAQPTASTESSFRPAVEAVKPETYPVKLLRECEGSAGVYAVGAVLEMDEVGVRIHCTPGINNAPPLAEATTAAGKRIVADQLAILGESIEKLRQHVKRELQSRPVTENQRKARQALKDNALAYGIEEAKQL